MKKSLLLLVALSLSITLFAKSNKNLPKETEVVVCIYRPSNFVGFGDVYNLKVNGKKKGKIKNGKKLILNLPIGKTKFKVRGTIIELDLQAGKTYYLRSVLVRNMLIGKPDLVAVNQEFAKTELKNIK